MADTISQIDFSKIPFAKDSSPCGYFPEKTCTQLFNMTPWFKDSEFIEMIGNVPEKEYYGFLKKNGFCRYYKLFYRYECENCSQCLPIRIPVEKFNASKNQKMVWRKNQDIEVVLEKNSEKFVSDERALLFREYDAYKNESQPDYVKKTLEEAKETLREMNSGYEGIWNLEFRLNGELIGVSILDYTVDSSGKTDAICSNYFYYEISERVKKRSIGVFSVLKEIELCKNLEIPYYYLGLYLSGCRSMNYKINYEPYELFVDGIWVSSELQFPEPGVIYKNYPEVCFATEEIELPILLAAYKQGVFPWFCEEAGEPVVWQSTDPRFVIPIEEFHVPKTIKKFLKHTPFTYSMDKCFEQVMEECSLMERKGQNGTWIGPKMLAAYSEFHRMGFAHSIEVWHDDRLVGGFYGILLGSVFCGESMFTLESGSSSSAFVLFAQAFEQCGGRLIDCQSYTDNMARYGAREIPRSEFLKMHKRFQRIRLLKDIKEVFSEISSR